MRKLKCNVLKKRKNKGKSKLYIQGQFYNLWCFFLRIFFLFINTVYIHQPIYTQMQTYLPHEHKYIYLQTNLLTLICSQKHLLTRVTIYLLLLSNSSTCKYKPSELVEWGTCSLTNTNTQYLTKPITYKQILQYTQKELLYLKTLNESQNR